MSIEEDLLNHAICAVSTIYLQKGAKDTEMIFKLMCQKQIENVMANKTKTVRNDKKYTKHNEEKLKTELHDF